MRSGLSYLWAAVKPKGKEENLEQWVSNRFGWRLYKHFFKGYTEKVWGVPTTELRAEWAAQRIKGLSFFSAAKAAFFGNGDNKIKSLITEFHYPRFGPGQMWETMCDEIIALGGEVRLNSPVEDIEIEDGRIVAIDAGGERIEPGEVISSLPLRATVGLAGAGRLRAGQAGRHGPALPRLPDRRAGDRRRGPVPRQLDLHPRGPGSTSAGSRTTAPGAPGWSPTPPRRAWAWSTSASRATSCGTWPTTTWSSWPSGSSRPSASPIPRRSSAGSSRAFRSPIPCTTPITRERVDSIRDWLGGIENLQQVGRNGLHRYNNSDHSMLTAIRAVENVVNGTSHDIWAVNAESVYHEEASRTSTRTAARPRRRRCASRWWRQRARNLTPSNLRWTHVRWSVSGSGARVESVLEGVRIGPQGPLMEELRKDSLETAARP